MRRREHWLHLEAPRSVHHKSESADNKPGGTRECQRHAWEHLELQQSSLGKTRSSFRILLVHLEIIATTYRSTIFITCVFSLYSHLCIYIATHLHTVYLEWLQVVLESNSRCAWRWQLSELRETLCGRDWVSLEMHLEEVIASVWSYTWRP